jgi:hypothetical protein
MMESERGMGRNLKSGTALQRDGSVQSIKKTRQQVLYALSPCFLILMDVDYTVIRSVKFQGVVYYCNKDERRMRIMILLALCCGPYMCPAQYTPSDTLLGVELSYKWAGEKWYNPHSDKVILIKVVNRNAYPVRYSFELELSRDGKMLESSPSPAYCIRGNRVAKGRLNGIILKPVSLSSGDIASRNFDLELTAISVETAEGCEPDR